MEFLVNLFPIILAITLGLWMGWLFGNWRKRKQRRTAAEILDLETFIKGMRKGQLIDIRKSDVFKKGAIKGARNFRPGFLKSKNQAQVRRDQPIYLYCERGFKAKRVAGKLLQRGFTKVYVLNGGYQAYKSGR